MKEERETVESDPPDVAEEEGEGGLGRLSPRQSLHWERCGYQAVFLWTRLFEQHLRKFHGRTEAFTSAGIYRTEPKERETR